MAHNSILKKPYFLILAFSLIVLTLSSCDHTKVDGIFVDHTLYENLSFSDQINLKELIRLTLENDEKALTKLNTFWCGGAAGCYDLGFVITQIIYKNGENGFIKMVQKLKKEDIMGLEGLIGLGLEYGDNNKDGKMDDKKIQTEFPRLYKILTDKTNNK